MRKMLTIGLAAAALAGGVAATSGAAQAADWNHGYHGHHRYDHGDRHHGRSWRRGYRHEVCRSYRTWSPRFHHYVTRTRCF